MSQHIYGDRDTAGEQYGDGTFDPDELFVTSTVSEVRAVQQQLRANADGKQEELRQMVGERYRDLLQASTSIISIAESAKRVQEALTQMREIVSATELPRTPKPSSAGDEDKHLHVLQSLSAHMKLLLDAPEHLWRFMERKSYLHASWLFLTARAVHHTLLHDSDDPEQDWGAYGIDVSEHLPLAQRQWETVSQFRAQITHKATLSLRENASSTADVCATLLTLHLLESRPLTETLTTFLAQRTKTLSSVLASSVNAVANGHAETSSGKTSSRGRKLQVKQRLQAALDVASRTLDTARAIFADGTELSLMKRTLQSIQSGDCKSGSLPVELQITTHSLLTSLPSSAHFTLLPSSIKSYKPYVDDTSASSVINQSQLLDKLDIWFTKTLEAIRVAMDRWFSSLENIREVWDVRQSSWNWIATIDGLSTHEETQYKSMVDDVSRQQIIAVWKSSLDLLTTSFEERLASCLKLLKEDAAPADSRPVDYLFQTLPQPSTVQAGGSPSVAAATFQRMRAALHRQLQGRTPLLDNVLNDLENRALQLEQDFDAMHIRDEESRALATKLKEAYRPDAEASCSKIVDSLVSTFDSLEATKSAMTLIIFVGRIADELTESSPFVKRIGCTPGASDDFRATLTKLYTRTLQTWKERTVTRTVEMYSSLYSVSHSLLGTKHLNILEQPSSAMLRVLLALCIGLQDLGAVLDTTRRHLIGECLQQLFLELLDDIARRSEQPPNSCLQIFVDMMFLRQLVSQWGDLDVSQRFSESGSKLREKLRIDDKTVLQVETSGNSAQCLLRMQTILDPLLPPTTPSDATKATTNGRTGSVSLLTHGSPTVEQQQELSSILKVVHPSARFGLLLVGNATVR